MLKTSVKENAVSHKSEFWGVCCESGKRYTQVVRKKFHISMAALDPTVTNTSPCVSLLVERGGSQYLLCNLKPDSILQVNLNLLFDKGEKITFFLKGHGTVHLSGYHIYDGDQSVPESPIKSPIVSPIKGKVQITYEDLISDSSEDTVAVEKLELVKNLKKELENAVVPNKKVNSPVASPAKKVQQPNEITMKKESLKDEEESSSDDDKSDEKAVVKKMNATPAKKMNATPAKNVKAQTPKATPKQQKKETSDEEESSEDEEKSSSDDDELLKKSGLDLKALQKYATSFNMKRPRSAGDKEESSDEEESSGEYDSSSGDSDAVQNREKSAQLKQKLNEFMNRKRVKMDTSTPASQTGNKKTADQKTPKSNTELIDLDSDSKTAKKSFNTSELNSSIGRTPMPKKFVSSFTNLSDSVNNTLELKKKIKNTSFAGEGDSSEAEAGAEKQAMDTSTQSIESKKKKRKRKSKAGLNASQVENAQGKANVSMPTPKTGKKLAGGIEYEDIRIGNGLEAKKGKLIHVYYTGKLDNNKIFDSKTAGSKPFSFNLGTGQVIKGWDIGVEGMKVGGKRRLRIPPQMGYKSQRMGEIPPNSTLNFVVELKAVS